MAHGLINLKHTKPSFVVLADDKPSSYKEVMNIDNACRWTTACDVEYDSLMGYHTWTLVERPQDVNLVSCRWFFHVKHDNLNRIDKYKARLIVQEYSQIPGLDFNEIYSPTIVTLCATPYQNSDFTSPLSHSHFQDPCSISITFLFLVLTFAPLICFETPYSDPNYLSLSSPFLPITPIPLTINFITPSWTYSSPLATLASLHHSR